MNSRGTNPESELVLHLCGASSEPTINPIDMGDISEFSLMNSQDFNIRMKPNIKPMEEPASTLSSLFLPPSVSDNQDPFSLDDNEEEESPSKVSEEEKNVESPCKIHQGILKMKVLAPKAPKFSIKKHLRTYYYNKRR